MQREEKPLHPSQPNGRTSGVVPKKKPSMSAFLSMAPLLEQITERMGGGFKVSEGGINLFITGRYEKLRRSGMHAAREIPLEFEESEAMLTVLSPAMDEKRMDELMRLALLGEVSAGMAHDMNNILTVFDANIHFFSEFLAGRRSYSLEELVVDMAEAVNIMKGICERTQRLASREEGLETVNVRELVESAVRLMKAPLRNASSAWEKEITITNDVPPHLTAELVYTHVQSAILNIMLNAVRHGIQREGRIDIRASGGCNAVILAIENDGVPVPESVRDSIFEKPLSRDCDNGYGLYTSAKNLRSFGARISFVSEPEQTTFFIILPASSDRDG